MQLVELSPTDSIHASLSLELLFFLYSISFTHDNFCPSPCDSLTPMSVALVSKTSKVKHDNGITLGSSFDRCSVMFMSACLTEQLRMARNGITGGEKMTMASPRVSPLSRKLLFPAAFWMTAMMVVASVMCVIPALFPDADADIMLEWNVSYITMSPLGIPQQVIGINGEFPGPQIAARTNDVIMVNVFNRLDEPVLFTWAGIQQRHNSWQDGVLGTNCEIPSHWNWTYKFQVKDQIGSFFYCPSTRFQRAAGGYGGIRIDSARMSPPFIKPSVDVVVLIGDWYTSSHKELRETLENGELIGRPNGVLINGYGPYNGIDPTGCWVLPVDHGSTYRLRISNVGVKTSLNFRIQSHKMLLVETEGSYTQQKLYDSLDVHVGQSYSALVTADQASSDYFIMASPRFENATTFVESAGVALMHYSDSHKLASGPHPPGPDADDIWFSLAQARSIAWNLSVGAARLNPQGSFHYGSITPTQTFFFQNSAPIIDGHQRFAVNNISFVPTSTPLKLADFFNISSGVYTLDGWPSLYSIQTSMLMFEPTLATTVLTGPYKAFVEIVFENTEATLQSWHLDGYAFWVVGMDRGRWSPTSRSEYNKVDAVARCTTQVFPRSWTAIMVMLDNVGIWNLRTENLQRQYLGQELYLRVVNPEMAPMNNSAYKEAPIPDNVMYCGWLSYKQQNQNSGSRLIFHINTFISLCIMQIIYILVFVEH